jgi:hypothetical protein
MQTTTSIEQINSEIESLRKQLESPKLSPKDREDCEERLREWIYDKKTFIKPVQKRKLKQIDTGSFVDCIIKKAIEGTFKWIIQKKQKQPIDPEFEIDTMWIFDSDKKTEDLLTFEQCCLFRKMNPENIRHAISVISKRKVQQIQEILVKFRINQERKFEDPIDALSSFCEKKEEQNSKIKRRYTQPHYSLFDSSRFMPREG